MFGRWNVSGSSMFQVTGSHYICQARKMPYSLSAHAIGYALKQIYR